MHKTIVLFTRQCIYQGLLVFLFVNVGSAQNATPYVPSILPPSPNAAALMKFADIPVSKYTGAVDVSVPIYTITAKGLSLPINIDYHTGGIRLKEEASYVGLGWALSCGGSISRTVMDKDDFNASDYFTNNVPQLQGDVSQDQFTQGGGSYPLTPYYIDFWCNYKVNFSTGTADYYNAFVANPTAYDLEPDIYSYNFAGKSGKFIITRSGKVILQKQDNLKVQSGSYGNSFTITDDEGNRYYFQDKEYATTAAMSWGPISTWNLTKIITSLNDSINFSYQTGTTTYLAPDQYEIYNANTHLNPGYITGSNSGVSYSNTAIKTVDFADGEIQFSYNSSRRDLQGALRLDSIRIYSKSSTGLTYVKGDNLFYSYFNDDATGQSNPYEYLRLRLDSVKEIGPGLSSSPYSFQYLLPLNEAYTKKHSYSVDHWGFCNGKGNTTFLPSIATLYSPPAGSIGYPYSYFTYSGADRSPDFNYMPVFTLDQVTYPTGGKSIFQYEENNYDQQKSITGPVDFPYSQLVTIDTLIQANTWGTTSGTINVSNIVPDNTPGESTTNLTLIVTFRATSSAALTTLKSTTPYGRISFTFNNSSYDFTNSANTCSGSVCSITVPLALVGGNNTIAWSSYIDQSVSPSYFTEIDARLQFQRVETLVNQANNDYRVPSGGLRIKSITDYSNASTIAKQRIYQYEYTTNNNGTTAFYTYGRQMSMPSYVRYSRDIAHSPDLIYDIGLSLFSSSINSLTSTVQGNIVGYDKVIEKTIDPTNNADNGETISTFYNLVDSACYYDGYRMPGILNMPNNLNGTLISQTEYTNLNGSYYPVSMDSNFYRTTNRQVYYSTKYNFPGQNTDTADIHSKCLYPMVTSSEAIICLYPSLKSEKILLDSTVNYVYDLSGNYVRSTKKYFYDNPAHYQVTRTSTVDSKGNSLISHIRYPQDYVPTGSSYTGNTTLDTMLSRNMLAETIEKQDSLYYSGSSTGYVTASQLSLYRILTGNSNTVIPDRIYKLDIQSPVTNFQPFSFSGNTLSIDSRYRQMISFDQYDGYNNIQQYTALDQNPVTIIWDYTNTYPIAQVKNAALSDVAATSFEADGKGGWSFTGVPSVTGGAITGTQSYNLSSGSLSKSGLTSGTKYIVSYWSKSTVTVGGGTQSNSITGKTINGWTYHELTVTGTTSLSISGSTYIDELRLYPVTAQMTTYTYAPLVGMTTVCDADNRITYYSYDGLGRLDRIKDQDGNIIKTFQYHFQNLTAPN